MKDKSRSDETKERFKKAFFELYATRKIETITIKEVAKLAGFNRGTFYLYYKNIYDLLQKSEQDILDDFAKDVDFTVQVYLGLVDKSDNEVLDKINKGFFKGHEYIRILNGENGDPRFKARMKNIIKDVYRKHFKPNKDIGINKFEYLLEYYVEANMSIVQYWTVNNDKGWTKVSIEDVWEIMHVVNEQGFKKAFEIYLDK